MAPPTYPSRGAWRFTNVTRDFDFWPTLDSISIATVHPDAVAAFSCRVVDPDASLDFGVEDEVVVTFRDERIWAGHLRSVGADEVSEVGPRVCDLEGQDYTATLDDSVITGREERPRESVTARVEWILTHLDYAVGFDEAELPDEEVEPASYEGATVREALERVAEEQGLHLSVDVEAVLHLSRTELLDAPFELSTSPDYATSYPYTAFRHALDSVELTNAVRVHGARHRRWVTRARLHRRLRAPGVLDRRRLAADARAGQAGGAAAARAARRAHRRGRARLLGAGPAGGHAGAHHQRPLGHRRRVRPDRGPHLRGGPPRRRGRGAPALGGDVHRRAPGRTAARGPARAGRTGPAAAAPGPAATRCPSTTRRSPSTAASPGSTSTRFSRTLSSDQDFGRADNDRAEDRYWDDMQEEG